MWHVWRLTCALQRVLVVFIASDALMLTQEPCQWLWSWILLETMMGLYAHKVCAVVDTRCCCAIVSIWATPYLQMLESNMPRDARASSLPHAMLKKVALAGPKSLHIITRVASSLAGQLRMMAGPILCSKLRATGVNHFFQARLRLNGTRSSRYSLQCVVVANGHSIIFRSS